MCRVAKFNFSRLNPSKSRILKGCDGGGGVLGHPWPARVYCLLEIMSIEELADLLIAVGTLAAYEAVCSEHDMMICD